MLVTFSFAQFSAQTKRSRSVFRPSDPPTQAPDSRETPFKKIENNQGTVTASHIFIQS